MDGALEGLGRGMREAGLCFFGYFGHSPVGEGTRYLAAGGMTPRSRGGASSRRHLRLQYQASRSLVFWEDREDYRMEYGSKSRFRALFMTQMSN
jgi:hypothetical protein